MLPDRVSNPGPLTYESGALPIALRGPASFSRLLELNTLTECLRYQDCIPNNKGHNSAYLNLMIILCLYEIDGKLLVHL